MKRLLSLLLLMLCGLSLLAPLLVFAADAEWTQSNLPACCRRSGLHQCGMSTAEQAQFAARPREWSRPSPPCPFQSALIATTQAGTFHGAPFPPPAVCAPALAHPSGAAQTMSRLRIARERSRHKRGPPRLS